MVLFEKKVSVFLRGILALQKAEELISILCSLAAAPGVWALHPMLGAGVWNKGAASDFLLPKTY